MVSSDLKFNIIEKRDINEIYPFFKKDFLNPSNTVDDLKRKFDLSRKEYNNLRSKVFNETGLKRKPCSRQQNIIITDDTYLNCTKNEKYIIMKSVDGEMKYFGQYDTKEEALKVRNKLIKQNWQE